jgi:hypothetical protein
LRSRQLCSYSRISQHFMEPEGSLPCSQEPSTGPYPEPDKSSSYHPILRSILILSSNLRLGLPSDLFPSDFFLPKNLTCLQLSSNACYIPSPSHPFCLRHSTNYFRNYTWRRVHVIKLLITQRTAWRHIAEDRILQKSLLCLIL